MSEKPRLAVGLMSGTSLDSVDAVLTEIRDDPFSVRTLAQVSQPFEPDARSTQHG